ncbi:hypothetical protein FNJ84_21420 [Paracoccus sp. M683]|uniref:hypothetical protein n=1 Tax=Paracoccus sp. M683 TaxID=2594268 RepID=UPI00117E0DE2|nr:hypothetical protein [Paracoccus sp. M683]TRW91947.1 hypothetical protein FNJ84_21420 [Paracoccus sp. M683]
MSAPCKIKEFRVDPSRLSSGTWCHSRDRQIGEGDISASYSGDKIGLEGCVRSPFKWQNCLWVCTGMVSRGDFRAADAYRLVPRRFLDGTPISYHENAMLGDEARTRPEGFYHGMAVRHGKQDYVLIGPSAVFMPSEDVQTPRQADLFDLL